jgi:hypothetical protein
MTGDIREHRSIQSGRVDGRLGDNLLARALLVLAGCFGVSQPLLVSGDLVDQTALRERHAGDVHAAPQHVRGKARQEDQAHDHQALRTGMIRIARGRQQGHVTSGPNSCESGDA